MHTIKFRLPHSSKLMAEVKSKTPLRGWAIVVLQFEWYGYHFVLSGKISETPFESSTVLRCANVYVNVMSLAERALKSAEVDSMRGEYIDCRFLVQTSNICERFFSSTKRRGDHRRATTPEYFNSKCFNADLWRLTDVQVY